jgi:hypothetical protein
MPESGVELDRWPRAVQGGHGGFLRKKIVVGKMREVTRMLHNWWRATKLAGSKQHKDNGRLAFAECCQRRD